MHRSSRNRQLYWVRRLGFSRPCSLSDTRADEPVQWGPVQIVERLRRIDNRSETDLSGSLGASERIRAADDMTSQPLRKRYEPTHGNPS